jgi:hypothetical protein
MRTYFTWLIATGIISLMMVVGAFVASSTGDDQTAFNILFGLAILLGIVFSVLLYFVPYMVARSRGVENITAVLLVNVLTGWCFIGWAAALVMAVVLPVRIPSHFEAFVRERIQARERIQPTL